ncbi:MAG: YARHG domain-containing protein [Rhizobiaceae bacterium]
MRKFFLVAAGAVIAFLPIAPTTVVAQSSCYDLWYARNLIYANNGYCFRTRLAIRTFGNAGCHTRNPRLSASERRRIARLQAEERRRGCKVNR